MPIYTCAVCSTLVLSPVVLEPEAITERCTLCTREQPLVFLDNLALEFEGTRQLVRESFDPGGTLEEVYTRAEATRLHESARLAWELELDPHPPTREGIVLSYLAQAIRNDGESLVHQLLKQWPNVVVVATLVVHEGQPLFVVGINGHHSTHQYAEMLASVIPKTIGGAPVVTVTDQLAPHESAVSKRLSDVPDLSGWSWHGEQKVLRYIKTTFGITTRLTATCIGIAHAAGPCTPDTAGIGTNHCHDYLRRKRQKDEEQIAVGGHATHGLAAYWYSGKKSSWNATLKTFA